MVLRLSHTTDSGCSSLESRVGEVSDLIQRVSDLGWVWWFCAVHRQCFFLIFPPKMLNDNASSENEKNQQLASVLQGTGISQSGQNTCWPSNTVRCYFVSFGDKSTKSCLFHIGNARCQINPFSKTNILLAENSFPCPLISGGKNWPLPGENKVVVLDLPQNVGGYKILIKSMVNFLLWLSCSNLTQYFPSLILVTTAKAYLSLSTCMARTLVPMKTYFGDGTLSSTIA